MVKCKKCKAIISLDLIDILKGTTSPKKVNNESIKQNLCLDCFGNRNITKEVEK